MKQRNSTISELIKLTLVEESQEGREAAGEPGTKDVTLASGQQKETEWKNGAMTVRCGGQ